MQKVKYYKCPHCGIKYKSLQLWGNHITSKHSGLIPDGWSYGRYFYFIQTGKKSGFCIVCKNPTEWHEATLKYERFCTNPKCKEQYREMFKNRMITKYGKVHLLDDPEQQRKMLANKHISGQYTFLDGTKVTYTGTYELDFLKFIDRFLHFSGNDIMVPSPHTYYYNYINENDKEHEGRHYYIPDAFIPSLNLEIEIKQNTNTHHKLLAIDKVKEKCKDEMMRNRTDVNYFKIVEKDYTGFIEYLEAQENIEPVMEVAFVKYKDTYISDPKKYLRLADFTFTTLTPGLISVFKKNCKGLSHVRINRDTFGELVVDGSHVVGYYNTENKDGVIWLQAFEICGKYKGRGLSPQLLTRAIRKGKVTNLSVSPKNEVAIKLYEKLGFINYGRTESTLLYKLKG